MDGGVGGSWEKVDRNDNSVFDEDLGLCYSVDEETLAELMNLATQLVTHDYSAQKSAEYC